MENAGGRQLEQRRGKRETAQGVCVRACQWCIVYFCPVLLWEINILSRSPEAEGHYRQTNTHAQTHSHTHTVPHVWQIFISLSVSLSFLLFFCCRETVGVNHYRQYRLKMQSPPGAQGHRRPMGGRRRVRAQMRTSPQPRAECKQSDSIANVCSATPTSFSFFFGFLILLNCQFNLLTLLILLWPFCSLMWLWFISSPSSISLVSFSFHPTASLGPSVPALWANNLIISHITTQTHKHITNSHNLDVFDAHLLHPVKWVKVYAVNYHQIIETKRETVKRFKDDRKWAWVITASVNFGQNTFFFF